MNYFAMGESFSNHPIAKSILKEVFDRLFLFNSEIKDINKESYLEDLKNVSGIGENKYEQIKEMIYV